MSIEIENHTPSEPVPLDQARYLDRIDDEYEHLWSRVVSDIAAAGVGTMMTMDTILQDSNIPPVFHDRAKLVKLGTWDARGALGVNTLRGGANFVGCAWGKQSIEEELQDESSWINETFEYQQAHGVELVSESTVLTTWLLQFAQGNIDDETLDTNLGRIDIVKASPTEDEDGYNFNPDRFPVVDDILNGNRASSERLTVWAREQAHRWLTAQQDKSIELPDWLSNVSPETGINLFRQKHFTYHDRWPLIQLFGWDSYLGSSNLFNLIDVAEALPTPEMQESLLIHILEVHRAGPSGPNNPYFHLSWIERLEVVAENIHNTSIHSKLQKERQQTEIADAEDDERWAQQKKKREEERQNSPERLRKQQAQERLQRTLKRIGELASKNTD